MELTQLGAQSYPAEGTPRALFVFAHGAGAGQHHPFMAGVSKALAGRGIEVCVDLASRLGLHVFDCLNMGSSFLDAVLNPPA